MIPFDTMSHMATHAFVIEELLETIYDVAKEANELAGGGKMGNLTYRIRHLVHGASSLTGTLANDLSDLMQHCQKDVDERSTDPEPAEPPVSAEEPTEADLGVLGLRATVERLLRADGVDTITKLTSMSETDLLYVPGIAGKSVDHIKERLAVIGLSLTEVQA